MNGTSTELWPQLCALLEAFASRVQMLNPTLKCTVAHSENDAFLMRGYLSFRANDDGDEVAISVDVQRREHLLVVTSDICWDDGRIIATGPNVSISACDDGENLRAVFNEWIDHFQQFLYDSEPALFEALSQLS